MNNQYASGTNIKEESHAVRSTSATPNMSNASASSSVKPQILQNATNLSNRVLAKPTSKLQQSVANTTPINVAKNPKLSLPTHLTQQRRSNTLNTKSKYRSQIIDASSSHYLSDKTLKNVKSYSLTNFFAESADFLFKFNHQTIASNKVTVSNALHLNRKLDSLLEFIRINLKVPMCPLELFGMTSIEPQANVSPQALFVVERIEFVCKRLNDEMLKLIHYFLFNSKSADDLGVHKHTTHPNTPINSLTIIDLLCLAFQICFELFLLRDSYLLL